MNSRLSVLTCLLLALFFLNVSDVIFTWLSVPAGAAHELNPVADWLISRGALTFFSVKIGVVSLILLYTYIRISRHEVTKFQIRVFTAVTIIMSVVVTLGLTGTLLTFL